jgi:glycosyltransferase involved in cell wall biosynthesis
MNKFSIIIPSFNEAEKLDASLSVIFDQMAALNLKCEVIVVDDCSTDQTDAIILKYSEKIKFFSTDKNSGGAGVPRNIGLKNISTDYFIFYDIGDVLDLECVNGLIQKMEAMDFNLCIAKHIDIGIDGEISHPLTTVFTGEDYITDLRTTPHLISNPFCWSKIYKSQWIRELGVEFGDIYCGEDKIFTWSSYLLANKIFISSEIMYGHKFFGGNVNRMLQRNIQLAESLIEIDKVMRIRFEYADLLGLYFIRLIKRDILGIILSEDSVEVMRQNGHLDDVLELMNNWVLDLFLESGLKVGEFFSSDEILIAKKYLKDFNLLIRAQEVAEKVGRKELLHYNNYATQLVNMNLKY